ncbi:MAG: hypothetical protein M3209_00325 [Acidobacteriota bacterium]|nr:hypothetical protein [Acidobacteriota bacterium]
MNEKSEYDKAVCEDCGNIFPFDKESGVNVREFPCEATSQYFRAGGIFPCCPKCEGTGHQHSDGFPAVRVTAIRRYARVEPFSQPTPPVNTAIEESIKTFDRMITEALLSSVPGMKKLTSPKDEK